MKPRLVTLDIQSLNERGYGVAELEEQMYFVLNALPGEQVEALIVKRKLGNLFGIAQTIINKSPLRLEPREDHFTSCSPWQILPIEEENNLKVEQIQTWFKEVGVVVNSQIYDGIEIDGYTTWNYRNKVEYSFYSEGEDLSLAYFKREGGFGKHPHDGCELIPQKANQVAVKIVEFLKSKQILAKQLKALLLRYSFANKQVMGKLFIKDEELVLDEAELQNLFDSLPDLSGLQIAYSTRKSPASVTTKLLNSFGDEYVNEQVLNKKFKYSIDGFFQVNPVAFNQTASDFRAMIDQIPNHNDLDLVDLYAGVGVLGQIVADQVKSVLAVESFPEIKEWAIENADINSISNYEFIEMPAEKSLESIEKADILIIDPPRVGLHLNVVEKILEVLPGTIIYLSCNPQSQARDYSLLKEKYKISVSKAYNYYPHTPHVEHLIVLEKI